MKYMSYFDCGMDKL